MALTAAVTCRRNHRDDLELFERYQQHGDSAALDALVDRFLGLALHLARRYARGSEYEDIEQVAALGLIKAIGRFDPNRGLAFTSFAMPTILGEIKRYFRDLGWSVRVPRTLQELAPRVEQATTALTAELGRTPTAREVAARCEVTIEQVVDARATVTAHRADSLDRPCGGEEDDLTRGELIGIEEPGFERVEQQTDIDRLLERLPEREQAIIRLRYEADLVQQDIADRVGLSQMHVSRLLRNALDTLAADADATEAQAC